MYNRYIPREDGSFSRNRMTEPKTPDIPDPPAPPQEPEPEPRAAIPNALRNGLGIGDFFRNLLPRKLDTADLLVLLLLLLMAGEQQEEQSNALLTMALYFLL